MGSRGSGKDASEPSPSAVLTGIAASIRLERALWAATRLGVADHLPLEPDAEAVAVEAIAPQVQADPDALHRLLRALASVGIFREDEGGGFRHTRLSAPLSRNAPDTVRDVILQYGDEPERRAWGAILHSVRTGEPAFERVWNESPWRYYEKTRGRMTQISRRDARALAGHPMFRGAEHIVDVAGGEGSFLAAILAANPDSRGTLLDRPEIVRGAPDLLEPAGVASRCAVVGGDMFEAVPAGADLYLLKRTLHDWNDDDALVLLQTIRSAMSDAGRLIVLTEILPPGNEPASSKLSDLALMVMLAGRHRTEGELRQLIDAAGFDVEEVVELPTSLWAIVAR